MSKNSKIRRVRISKNLDTMLKNLSSFYNRDTNYIIRFAIERLYIFTFFNSYEE